MPQLIAPPRLIGPARRLAAFSPTDLFAASEVGGFYDPSDLTSLYQSRTGGSIASADGQAIGITLDKRLMGGKTAAAFIAAQSELVTNGTFDADASWTKGTGWTISGGQAVASGASAFSELGQTIVAAAGDTFVITLSCTVTAGSLLVWIGTSATSVSVTTSGEKTIILKASGSNSIKIVASGSGFTGTVDNVSVKALPGYHMIAPSDAARPL